MSDKKESLEELEQPEKDEVTLFDQKQDSDPKESTRSKIATLYVWAFFIVIAIVFVVGLIIGFEVEDYKDMLVTVSGVLSGPLGFIVGYYFKASKE